MGVNEGSRNNACVKLTGYYYGKLPQDQWSQVPSLMLDWNDKNDPPLSESEVLDIAGRIKEKELNKQLAIGDFDPSRTGVTSKQKPLILTSHQELYNTDFSPLKWLIEGILVEGSLNVISGAPESYKTWMTLLMAQSVATGKEFLDMFSVSARGGVLFIDEESGDRRMSWRTSKLKFHPKVDIHYFFQRNFQITDLKHLAQTKQLIKTLGIKLVIIDSLVRIHGENENEATGMSKVMSNLRQLCENDVTVIFIHHNSKSGEGGTGKAMRGSGDIWAGVDGSFYCEINPITRLGKFSQVKTRDSAKKSTVFFQANDKDDGPIFLRFWQEDKDLQIEKDKQIILEVVKTQSDLTKKQVIAQAKLAEKYGMDCLNALIRDGLVIIKKGNGRSQLCSLPILEEVGNQPTLFGEMESETASSETVKW